ncbi:Na+/H+ antiporter NhaA [Actinomadura parmotrematis]|uniref:Na(+)/H(+) antiporter NhaA n=1 Tax=Actinomadura parmotrematis TaxID=2864039 RepID=A0ABS7FMK5_9ACTN|nr:Na+/H+ antiporter NhaA [Actinomadura parmotrematis]MBW8481591.1 Na+/H+ antiporter NhaA [Actinomadura parmotrematis]
MADGTAPERTLVERATPAGLRAYLSTESGSTSILLAATVAGLLWANSPWRDTYATFWDTELSVRLGPHALGLDLKHLVNDGLMALFFFVIGLEISREVQVGQLRDRRLVAVPALAALGGMLVPALLYALVNHGGAGVNGWGIPMASDTAFVLGLLAVLGTRCPEPLRAFLLTLSVVDDIGAILVVAVFYTEDFSLTALLIALALIGLIVASRWLRLWRTPAYVLLGLGVWGAMLESGVHPTLAGILLGALVTVYAPSDQRFLEAGELVRRLQRDPSPELAERTTRSVRDTVSVNERLQLRLHPWTSDVIVPIFALANAGVRLDGPTLRMAATSPITWGIVLALPLGKFLGVALGTWLPLRLNWGVLPGSLVWGQVLGGAAVSGIGFTVALFITELAFGDAPDLQAQAKIGILAGSLLAAAAGWLIFRLAWNRGEVCAPPGAMPADEEGFVPEPIPPVTADDHAHGPAAAPVTLVEYGDYECPYCGEAYRTLKALCDRYGDRIRLVWRHFPLHEVHPRAIAAAIVAEEAAQHGRFWEMHDTLFHNQLALTDGDLVRYARDLGIDDPWRHITENRRRIDADRASGERSGVHGTPTFFVNGRLYEGRNDLASLSAAVQAALDGAATADDRCATDGRAP